MGLKKIHLSSSCKIRFLDVLGSVSSYFYELIYSFISHKTISIFRVIPRHWYLLIATLTPVGYCPEQGNNTEIEDKNEEFHNRNLVIVGIVDPRIIFTS